MANHNSPDKLTICCYNVGFGDCFLLTFRYGESKEKHVLIDFGTSSKPTGAEKSLMTDIAKDIKTRCQDKLHAVVVTHRHLDHLSGFETAAGGEGVGDIIASMKPEVVIQPWTEDPLAARDARVPTHPDPANPNPLLITALQDMNTLARAVLAEARRDDCPFVGEVREELGFLGEEGIKNKAAVENLLSMGTDKTKRCYVYCGSKSGLESLLPGVTTTVLGPPTLEQTEAIRKQTKRHEDEFWHFARFWAFQARASGVSGKRELLFPDAANVDSSEAPPYTRWFLDQLQSIRGEQLLEIVRVLDSAMNNTSVILLFEVGGKKLLFSGDAQIENWAYALEQPQLKDLLRGVTFYKVGHHGSLNATPKSLWGLFENRSTTVSEDRLRTVVSTKPGKHGSEAKGTEVPRKKLVAALKAKSNYFSTHDMTPEDGLYKQFTVDLET
jgi:hypothetical protein